MRRVSCEVLTSTAPQAVGVFLPAAPSDCFEPSKQAASMCLMGTTLTRMNHKDVLRCFLKGMEAKWPQRGNYNLRGRGQIGDFSLGSHEC